MKEIKISNKLEREFESCKLLAMAIQSREMDDKQLLEHLIRFYNNNITEDERKLENELNPFGR